MLKLLIRPAHFVHGRRRLEIPERDVREERKTVGMEVRMIHIGLLCSSREECLLESKIFLVTSRLETQKAKIGGAGLPFCKCIGN
jgi:hypothetical protein